MVLFSKLPWCVRLSTRFRVVATSEIFENVQNCITSTRTYGTTAVFHRASAAELWKDFHDRFRTAATISDSQSTCKHYIRENFAYGEFNKYGRINPWELLKYQEATGIMFNVFPESSNVSLVLRSVRMKFLPAFYNTSLVGRRVRFTTWPSYLGKSSTYWDVKFLDQETDEKLVEFLPQTVAFDMKARTSAPLPIYFDKYRKRMTRNKPPCIPPLAPKPDMTYTYTHRITFSDTDFNFHANHAQYLRFVLDCAGFAAVDRFLTSFSKEITYYQMKEYTVTFFGEAKPGEEITITCWEDKNPLLLNFEISKSSKLLAQCRASFYSGDCIMEQQMKSIQ